MLSDQCPLCMRREQRSCPLRRKTGVEMLPPQTACKNFKQDILRNDDYQWTTVIMVRIPWDVRDEINRLAKERHHTRTKVTQDALIAAFGGKKNDPVS